ncbi:MAG TPA: hypothetical protein VLM40_01470 [Gemmata sp.]|nr:hypothetical protein [Gemmata sp.]
MKVVRDSVAAPAEWQERALTVGFFDEGYQASQMWKAEWESLNGDQVAARARAVVEMVEPLRGQAGGTAPPSGTGTSTTTESSPG